MSDDVLAAAEAALESALSGDAPWPADALYLGRPPLDTPPGYVAYALTDSKPGKRTSFTQEERELEYTFVAVSTDPTEARAWRAFVEATLIWRTVAVAGWTMNSPMRWLGYTPYAAWLEPDGSLLHAQGVRVHACVIRQRPG